MTMPQFKLIHDDSFAERNANNSYLIVKIYDEANAEVGQVKLEVHAGTDNAPMVIEGQSPAHINVTTSGKVSMLHTHE
jgi:hypothetical protein